MSKMITSRLLSRNTKKKLYIAYLCPILMYGCKTWFTMQYDKNKLKGFERKILKNLYGSTANANTGIYEWNVDFNKL